MRIAVLHDDFPPYHGGGGGVVALELSREFQKRGHEVLVITTVRDISQEGEGMYEGMRVVRFYYANYHERWRAYRGLWNPKLVGRAKDILDRFKPDIVHVHNVHRYLSYRLIQVAKKYAPVFLTAHDVMSFEYGKLITPNDSYRVSAWKQFMNQRFRYNPFRNMYIRKCFRGVNIIAVSNELKRALEENNISVPYVIHNGIDARAWTINPETAQYAKNNLGLQGKKVVLYVGPITMAKGANTTYDAIKKVKKIIPAAVLLVAGHIEKELPDFVYTTGWLAGEALKDVYRAADVVVQPSLCFESFGRVALEGMAMRKPVIGTIFGGAREVILDGETGYVIDPRDTDLFSQKIVTILSNNTVAIHYGEKGRKRVEETFSLKILADRYIHVFKSRTM